MSTFLPARDRSVAVWLSIALLAASYFLFSIRTVINPVDPGEIVNVKRLLASAVGATMFWLIATRSRAVAARTRKIRLGELAPLVFAAVGMVLVSRVGFDLLAGSDSEADLANNVRWVIAWSGYFGAALMAFRVTLLQRALEESALDEPVAYILSPGKHASRYEEADPVAREIAAIPR